MRIAYIHDPKICTLGRIRPHIIEEREMLIHPTERDNYDILYVFEEWEDLHWSI